eukprot:273817-Rhodomonas_salina.2
MLAYIDLLIANSQWYNNEQMTDNNTINDPAVIQALQHLHNKFVGLDINRASKKPTAPVEFRAVLAMINSALCAVHCLKLKVFPGTCTEVYMLNPDSMQLVLNFLIMPLILPVLVRLLDNPNRSAGDVLWRLLHQTRALPNSKMPLATHSPQSSLPWEKGWVWTIEVSQ